MVYTKYHCDGPESDKKQPPADVTTTITTCQHNFGQQERVDIIKGSQKSAEKKTAGNCGFSSGKLLVCSNGWF